MTERPDDQVTNMDELVEGLLACEDVKERRAFLEGWGETFSHLRLVEALKQLADGVLRTDPAQARRMADVAQEIASQADDPLCQATAAWCAGNAGFYLGHYQECLESYRQAIPAFEEAGMGLEAARLRANCVAVLTDLGHYEEALAEASIARQALAIPGPTRFLAALEMNVAVLHRHLDDYGAALAACDRGREIALALGSSVQAARFAVNRALILENLDSYRAAVATLVEVLPVFDQHGEVMEAARTQLNLGLLYTRMGRYRQALRALERARQGFAALDNEMEVAVVDWHRAGVYLKLNLLPEVIELCERTRSIFAERGLVRQAAMADSEAAQAYQRIGEPEEALRLMEQARQELGEGKAPVQLALLDLVQAGLYADRGAPTEALALAEGSLAALEPGPFPIKRAQARLSIADCYRALGRLEEAEGVYREALEVVRPAGLADLTCRAQYGLGRIAESRGDDAEALTWYRQAMDTVTLASVGLGGAEFRASFLADKLAAHQGAVALSLRAGDVAAAFTYAEEARTSAGLLMSLHTDDPAPSSAPFDPLTAELVQRRDDWNWHYSRLDRLQWEVARSETGHSEQSGDEAEVLRQLQATELHLADLVHRARLRYGVQYGAPADLTEVQAYLQPDEVLLAYFVARDQIVGFLVGQAHVVPASDLPSLEAISQRLDRLRFSLRRETDESVNHLAQLHQALLAPFEPYLSDGHIQRLIVVPHDLLFHLPFHALHDGQGYLLERFEVVYLPAASLLGHGTLSVSRSNFARPGSPDPGPKRGFAPLAPQLWGEGGRAILDPLSLSKGRPGDHPRRALIVGHDHDGRLPAALEEAQTIHEILAAAASKTGIEPRLLLSEDATDASLRHHAPDCGVLHLATHGVFRQDNPLFSALRLADNWLTLADVERLALPQAPLVTLSACETGLGDLRGSDIFGLSQAFLQAGAASLVVSLWPVPDEATRQLMIHFYRNLVAGKSKAAALRSAQLTLRSDPVHGHPLHWAGFVLIGDGGTLWWDDLTASEKGKNTDGQPV